MSNGGDTRAQRIDVGQLPPPLVPSWEDLGFAPWAEPTVRWLAEALPILGIYLVARLGLLVADVLSAHAAYGRNLDAPFVAWDAHWYMQIASQWYPARAPMVSGHLTWAAANFLPFFPIFIKGLESVWFPPIAAGVAVSLVAGAAATLLVWRLGAMAFDERTGRIGAILFIVFPGMGIVWGSLYCECVGLALAAGCLLMLCKKRALWAGVFGTCATLTSPMAVVPLTAAAATALVLSWRHREDRLRPAVATLMVPAGFGVYAIWIGMRYHDLLYYWHLGHQVWGTSADFGRSIVTVLLHPTRQAFVGPGWLEWLGLLAVIGAAIAIVKARPPAILTVYCGAVIAQCVVLNALGFRPRNLTWAFPALIAVAAVLRRRAWQPLAVSFAILMPLVFLAYTTVGNTMGAP